MAAAELRMSASNSDSAPAPLTGARSRNVDEPALEQLRRGVQRSCALIGPESPPARSADELRAYSAPRQHVAMGVHDHEHPLMLHLRRIGSEWQVCQPTQTG
jgi:hypothetical protein